MEPIRAWRQETLRLRLIGHRKTKRVPTHGLDEGTVQGTPIGFAQLPGRFTEFQYKTAEFVRRCGGGNGLSK